MALFDRWLNTLRTNRLHREIEEEMESHIAEAIADGRDPDEVRRAFGSTLRLREQSRDTQIVTSVDTLRTDVVLGVRRLLAHRIASCVVIGSLALATGVTTAAFRLVDGMLLSPLPVPAADRLHSISLHAEIPDWPKRWDQISLPLLHEMQQAVGDRAELVAAAPTRSFDVVFAAADRQTERLQAQYVSGSLFPTLGVEPAVGRLLTKTDDVTPGAHPYAVITERLWRSRFGGEPTVVGTTFTYRGTVFEIVGVVRGRFAGIETGQRADLFVPSQMHPRAANVHRNWLRPFAVLESPGSRAAVQAELRTVWRAFEEQRWRDVASFDAAWKTHYLNETELELRAAPAGTSATQQQYLQPLLILSGLALLVLMVACANAANLLGARAIDRARELAFRVAIGAGRTRLVRMVVVETAMLAVLGVGLGLVLSTWFSRWLVTEVSSVSTLHLDLPFDTRLWVFSGCLALLVTALCSLVSARGALAVRPQAVLQARFGSPAANRWMRWLVAGQVAFAFTIVLTATLLAVSLERLRDQPVGFDPEGVIAMTTSAPMLPAQRWQEMASTLAVYPQVESAAYAEWPLLDGSNTSLKVAVDGGPPDDKLTEFLCISPGWLDVMRLPLIAGRAFTTDDRYPRSVLVNETLARRHFADGPAVAKTLEIVGSTGQRLPLNVVGVVGDTRPNDLRSAPPQAAYVPCANLDEPPGNDALGWATFLARVAPSAPPGIQTALTRLISKTGEFEVREATTHREIVDQHTHREFLLARLAGLFAFAVMALSALGIYGTVHQTVCRRRRELCLRMALGARPGSVIGEVCRDTALTVAFGAAIGALGGLLVARSLGSLLFEVRAADVSVQGLTVAILAATAALAALPAVWRAVRFEPAQVLKSE